MAYAATRYNTSAHTLRLRRSALRIGVDMEDRPGGRVARPQQRRRLSDPDLFSVVRCHDDSRLYSRVHFGGAGDRMGRAAATRKLGYTMAEVMLRLQIESK